MNFKKYHVSKNLLNNTAESTSIPNVTITVNADKTITLNGALIESTKYITLGYVDFVEGEEYTISGVTGFTYNTLQIFVTSKLAFPAGNRLQCYNGAVTRTARASERCEVTLYMYNTAVYNDVVVSPQINKGSSALPYEPYSSEVWHDIPHYIHNTSTDTITTPADIYANDTTATVGLKGQMSQIGTPTPTTPIQPSECGEKTANLIDYTQSETGGIDNSGNLVPAINLWRSTVYTAIDATLQYFVSWTSNTNLNAVRINYYASDKTHILRETLYNSGTELTIPQNAAYFKWTLYAKSDFTVDLSFVQSLQLMINSGSTALPYEPFGVKIPILNNSQTTNVYLGEVQTTRKIKKLVLTGQEDWTYSASGNKKRVYVTGFDGAQLGASSLCSHFVNTDYVSYPDSGKYAINASSTTQTMIFGVTDMAITSATDWTTYLAQQYAAGTPVCVWYVLVTPKTGIVNEPIRKIGDYADEVSGITIPTIAGANTISVDTTLQPSEVSVNYHGWHPVADVHERENGQWD